MIFYQQGDYIQSDNLADDPTDFTSYNNSSKFTTIGRHENVQEEAESKLERERRLIEKEGEELRAREREVAERWMLNDEIKEPSAGSASRSRLRIRAILEKQAKQRVCMNVFLTFDLHLTFGIYPQEEDEKVRQQKSESQDDMSKFIWAFKMK